MWRKRLDIEDQRERIVKDVEKARKRTMDRAVRLLAAKPRSIRELRERLLEKLWTNDDIVEAVIEKLKEYKYLDDEQYAAGVAAASLRTKPQGRRRLQHAMSQKKLDRETVEKAVAEAFEATPESDLLDQALEKRLRLKGRPETHEDAKRLADHLLRRGFSFDLVREKLRGIKDVDLDDA